MAGAMRKVGEYLGLVEQADFDDEFEELEPTGTGGAVAHRASVAQIDERTDNRPYNRASNRRDGRDERRDEREARARASAPRAVREVPEQQSITDLARIETVTPRTYNDARTVGEHFRDRVPVIMNLSEIDDDDAKRLVDFAAGLVFAVHGTLNRVTAKVFLLSPSSVMVTDEDKQRIAAGGFYNQS